MLFDLRRLSSGERLPVAKKRSHWLGEVKRPVSASTLWTSGIPPRREAPFRGTLGAEASRKLRVLAGLP
jgi:hypothetical protein